MSFGFNKISVFIQTLVSQKDNSGMYLYNILISHDFEIVKETLIGDKGMSIVKIESNAVILLTLLQLKMFLLLL